MEGGDEMWRCSKEAVTSCRSFSTLTNVIGYKRYKTRKRSADINTEAKKKNLLSGIEVLRGRVGVMTFSAYHIFFFLCV